MHNDAPGHSVILQAQGIMVHSVIFLINFVQTIRFLIILSVVHIILINVI